jgi:hypothetical protein
VFARARPAWDSRSPQNAVFKTYIDFNCRIATRIQDLARMDLANAGVRHMILGGLEQLSQIEANHLS